MKNYARLLGMILFAAALALTGCDTGEKDNNKSMLPLILIGSGGELHIGKNYLGGKIAYILQSGDPGYDANVPHGLIAAKSDQGTTIMWSVYPNNLTLVPGGTGTALGTGSANTDNIIAQNGAGPTHAAGLARAYNGGRYTDWYLPSRKELAKLFDNKVAIGGFADTYYWSSSECDASSVYVQKFDTGIVYNVNKDVNVRVRAVRTF